MRFRVLLLVSLFSSIYGVGQAGGVQGGVSPRARSTTAAAAPAVAPDAPVITISGLCDDKWLAGLTIEPAPSQGSEDKETTTTQKAGPGQDSKDCKMVITRAEWEKFSDAVQPAGGPQPVVPAPANTKLVKRYSELMLYARKAREEGMDKDPAVRQEIRFATLQILSAALTRSFRAQAEQISDAEVAKIYKENPDRFDEVVLQRIFIPKTRHHAPDASLTAASKSDPAADEAEMRAVADKIQKEAVAGEDFQKLEDDAYHAAGNDQSPSVEMGTLNRAIIPPEYKDVIFGLKVGEVSPVEPSTNGWHIFRVTYKEVVPLERARPIIVSERMADIVEPFRTSIKVQTNDQYFEKSGAR